jgi:hypothetical protein
MIILFNFVILAFLKFFSYLRLFLYLNLKKIAEKEYSKKPNNTNKADF